LARCIYGMISIRAWAFLVINQTEECTRDLCRRLIVTDILALVQRRRWPAIFKFYSLFPCNLRPSQVCTYYCPRMRRSNAFSGVCPSVRLSVCLSVCMSVMLPTFESPDLESSFLVYTYILRTSRPSSYIKVIRSRSRSRSQEQKARFCIMFAGAWSDFDWKVVLYDSLQRICIERKFRGG